MTKLLTIDLPAISPLKNHESVEVLCDIRQDSEGCIESIVVDEVTLFNTKGKQVTAKRLLGRNVQRIGDVIYNRIMNN